LSADLGPAIRIGQPGFFISEILKRAFTMRELINTRTHKHLAVADVRDGSIAKSWRLKLEKPRRTGYRMRGV
jgi:hypothetical protein